MTATTTTSTNDKKPILDAYPVEPENRHIWEGLSYLYKDHIYQVLEVRHNVLVRDDKNQWQPSVMYMRTDTPNLIFYRALNDFRKKYLPIKA